MNQCEARTAKCYDNIYIVFIIFQWTEAHITYITYLYQVGLWISLDAICTVRFP